MEYHYQEPEKILVAKTLQPYKKWHFENVTTVGSHFSGKIWINVTRKP